MVGIWSIYRDYPFGPTLGVVIPAFVKNVDYHLTEIEVFADGVICAWEYLDLARFRQKVASGWIATAPPVGASINVFNLGSATAMESRWRLESHHIVERVEAALEVLNPKKSNLVEMQESDLEPCDWGRPPADKVRYSKLVRADREPFVALETFFIGGKKDYSAHPVHTTLSCIPREPPILGDRVSIFRRESDHYCLEPWFVFADGSSRVGCEEPRQPLEEAFERMRSGELCTGVRDGSWIKIGDLGCFRVTKGSWYVRRKERRRELLDLLNEVRGGDSAVESCREAFEHFQEAPTEQNRELLRSAYEAVPMHLRMFCGDMDNKDARIREAIWRGPRRSS